MSKVLANEEAGWNQPVPKITPLTITLISRPELYGDINATADDRPDAGRDEFRNDGKTFTRDELHEAIDRKKNVLTRRERWAAAMGGAVLGVVAGLAYAHANHAEYVEHIHHLAVGAIRDRGNYFVNVSGMCGFMGMGAGYGSAILARERLARYRANRVIDRLTQRASELVVPSMIDASKSYTTPYDLAPTRSSITIDQVVVPEPFTSTSPLTQLSPIGENGTLSRSWSFEPVCLEPPITEIPPVMPIEDYRPPEINNVFATAW